MFRFLQHPSRFKAVPPLDPKSFLWFVTSSRCAAAEHCAFCIEARCTGDPKTIRLLSTTTDWPFGRCRPVARNTRGGYSSDSSQTSFLFTIKNLHDLSGQIRQAQDGSAIYDASSYVPSFGYVGCFTRTTNIAGRSSNSGMHIDHERISRDRIDKQMRLRQTHMSGAKLGVLMVQMSAAVHRDCDLTCPAKASFPGKGRRTHAPTKTDSCTDSPRVAERDLSGAPAAPTPARRS